jgi:hypothetical protein
MSYGMNHIVRQALASIVTIAALVGCASPQPPSSNNDYKCRVVTRIDGDIFDREPDFVLRKQSQAGVPATWMRGWHTPIRFEGRTIYVVQVGRSVD